MLYRTQIDFIARRIRLESRTNHFVATFPILGCPSKKELKTIAAALSLFESDSLARFAGTSDRKKRLSIYVETPEVHALRRKKTLFIPERLTRAQTDDCCAYTSRSTVWFEKGQFDVSDAAHELWHATFIFDSVPLHLRDFFHLDFPHGLRTTLYLVKHPLLAGLELSLQKHWQQQFERAGLDSEDATEYNSLLDRYNGDMPLSPDLRRKMARFEGAAKGAFISEYAACGPFANERHSMLDYLIECLVATQNATPGKRYSRKHLHHCDPTMLRVGDRLIEDRRAGRTPQETLPFLQAILTESVTRET